MDAPGPIRISSHCELCIAAFLWCSAACCVIGLPPTRGGFADANSLMENPMQHFHVGNLDKIRDVQPDAWATVHCNDFVTFSELVRRGFHLVDMRGEIWTMRRPG